MSSIPLFPLNLVLYPEERLPIHIFEDRYKQLITHVLRNDLEFGIVCMRDGVLAPIGTSVRVEKIIEKYPDGRLDLLVCGVSKFRIISVSDQMASYSVAQVEPLPDLKAEDINLDIVKRVVALHMRMLELSNRRIRSSEYFRIHNMSYSLAHNCALSLDRKIELLSMISENERMQFLASHIEALIHEIQFKEGVKKKVQSNGHFRDFPI